LPSDFTRQHQLQSRKPSSRRHRTSRHSSLEDLRAHARYYGSKTGPREAEGGLADKMWNMKQSEARDLSKAVRNRRSRMTDEDSLLLDGKRRRSTVGPWM